MSINDSMYYYVKNLQGDITKIVNHQGKVMVEYTYDAWGNILKEKSNVTPSYATVKEFNPFRYRGYVYDTDTGLYYLQSRYYDPKTGRFINADDTAYVDTNSGTPLSTNMFAYCENNHINDTDPWGYLGKHWWNSVKWVSRIIDAVLLVISVGKTYMATRALKTFLKRNKNKVIRQIRGKIMSLFGKTVSKALPQIINVALTLLGTTIGELIAKAIDYADKWWGYTRNNGYLFN